MANQTLTSKLVIRNDTAITWTTVNPVLLKGELGVENDTKKFKFGDGVSAWNSLPYASATSAHISNSAPLSTDIKYDLGTLWLNTSDSSVYTLMAISTTAVWTKIVTTTELVNALTAYMQISTYDSNGDGSVDKADKLKTARTISLTGDATGSTSFDGSVDKSIALTLANSGVTAGTYTKVTVDAKGRVTVGNGLAAADIPTLTLSKISDAGTAASKNTGIASGNIPILGSSGKLDTAVLPAIAITEVFTTNSETSMLALAAQTGDVCIRTDVNKSYILSANTPSVLNAWIELRTPTDSVLSVNGKTGAVVLTTSDIAEGSKLYYTEARATANFKTHASSELTDGSSLVHSTDTVIINCGNA